MVKRIKKKIPKQDAPQDETQPEVVPPAEEEAATSEVQAELLAVAEDPFTAKTARAFQWLLDHKVGVLSCVGVVAVGLGAWSYVQHSRRQAAEEATKAFQGAHETYVKAYELPKDAAEDAVPSPKKADLEKARDEFEKVRTTYSDRPVGALAALGKAGALMDLGDAAGALAAYDEILKRTDLDKLTQVVALQGKATAQENKGELDAAIATWKTIEGLDTKAFALQSGLQVGRLLEATGKADQAKDIYQKLVKEQKAALEDMANRGYKAELDQRMSRLGVDVAG